MRLILFISLLLLPQWLLAQVGKYEDGYYVLADSPSLHHPGQLKLRNENTLLVKAAGSKKEELDLATVLYFQKGTHKFKPVNSFHISRGLGGIDVNRGFAEVLDSGQVVLYEYSYLLTRAPMMSGNGSMTGGGSSWQTVYLLQRTGDQRTTTVISANGFSGAGKEFRESAAPFFTSRPDILKHLEERRMTIWHLKDAVHALNTGISFFPVSPWATPAN